ncbi:MAG: LCP family protein [Lachnospiraceae bacterium]|nr:LCP family protein [Lachnospiraceae bacterium]
MSERKQGEKRTEMTSQNAGDAKAPKKSERQGKKPNGKLRAILLVVEIVVLVLVIGLLYVETRIERINKADLSGDNLAANSAASSGTENVAAEEGSTEAESESADVTGQDEYREIALFGVDSLEGELSQKTRSDSIMILCINETKNEAKLVSVYRDTLLNLGDGTYNKCNAAYARGGPEQAIRMLNSNFDLNITDFVTIGFSGLTDVINALGGVEIDIDERELSHINDYQLTMSQELGCDYTEVTKTGLQTLDGLQATAYCRIRYTYGWDYRRAARQREVMYQIIDKAKQASSSTLAKVANDLFPEVYTSYDLTNLTLDISKVYDITVQEEDDPSSMKNGVPLEEYRIQAELGNSLGDCVVPRSLTDNAKWLHSYLFGEENYTPSGTVQEYSDYIDAFTKDAVPEEMTEADHT